MGMDTKHILWRQKYLYWDLNSAIIIEEAVLGTGEGRDNIWVEKA